MPTSNRESTTATLRIKAYIQEHLQEPITASDLAKAAGYSQYHAARIFKTETGLSPFEYLRQQRLTASAHALRSGKHRVIDVALDFVFDSHEGFTRAFTNAFGISPKRFAARPTPEGWLILYRYLNRANSQSEVLPMNPTAFIFTQIVERPARKLILMRSKAAEDYFAYAAEIGCGEKNISAAWDVLCEIKEALYEPVGVWLPENMRPTGTGTYALGVEVSTDYSGCIPEGFDIIDLPPCQLLVFQGEPYDDENFEEAVGQLCSASKALTRRFTATITRRNWLPECSWHPKAGAATSRCCRSSACSRLEIKLRTKNIPIVVCLFSQPTSANSAPGRADFPVLQRKL
ncbi:MAG: AraC family transcriptional regulator [Anaerolineaceae bacterium]|nr:AraC family transcriptional regulator [Brevefilum sp.]